MGLADNQRQLLIIIITKNPLLITTMKLNMPNLVGVVRLVLELMF